MFVGSKLETDHRFVKHIDGLSTFFSSSSSRRLFSFRVDCSRYELPLIAGSSQLALLSGVAVSAKHVDSGAKPCETFRYLTIISPEIQCPSSALVKNYTQCFHTSAGLIFAPRKMQLLRRSDTKIWSLSQASQATVLTGGGDLREAQTTSSCLLAFPAFDRKTGLNNRHLNSKRGIRLR